MTGRLDGQTAVVTGASRGIGRAIAEAYGREGAAVVCAARSLEQLREVVDGIEQRGGTAVAVACDITDDAQVDDLVQQTEQSFGAVVTLVNNAGAYMPGRFLDYELEDFRRIMEVNWLGTVRVTRAFLPGMLEREHGRIINIASTAGKYGSLFQSPYNSSKHAVVGLTRCLALETAKQGVRVNAICPGFVETDMITGDAVTGLAGILGIDEDDVIPTVLQRVPIGRMLQPEEVAELAVYLASPPADAMTGQALTVSGGLILV